ncbi:ABC transporter permease subunit [Micromonospora coerulea]|uniref:ABC transporter permease subunit n=1 Tax=Micromonospora coerulea TaxID=47856 RepID=UPI0027DB1CE6|nr:ABC transporter permease subunit [Micromonospora veneta]
MVDIAERPARLAAPAAVPPPAPAGPGPTRPARLLGLGGRALHRSAALLALAAGWEAVPRAGLVDRVFLPPLSEVLTAWWALLRGGQLADHVGASLTRSLTGLALAVLTAIPLGLLIGWYRPLADLLSPLLEVFRNTAALALLPVFVLILGLGETSKIALVLYACSWPILLNTIAGVKGVDPLLIRSARSMGLNHLRLFQKIILPAAVPTAVQSHQSRYQLVVELARRENLTIRQLIGRLGGGRGHRVVAGTPEQIADQIELWFTQGAADGFNVMPPLLPHGLEAFVDHVVPLLRERGLFRPEYTGRTLREHYGLPRPASTYAGRELVTA